METNSVKRKTHFRSISLAISLAIGLAGCGGSSTNSDFASVDASVPVSDWKLIWSDEFDGAAIDSSKWTHEVNCDGGGNQEQQCYTDSAENSFLDSGMLNIVAKPSVDGEPLPYTSARMVTKYQGDWTYGRFEMRAKLPEGQGTWPAFWMLSSDEIYGEWPRSGEIDILEAVNLKADDNGAEERSIVGQLYYGSGTANANNQFDSSGKTFDLLDGSNPADDFHTYAIEWQEGEIRWYVDGYLFQTQKQSEVRFNSKGEAVGLVHRGWYAEFFNQVTGILEDNWTAAPFDQDFHLLLNLAVGGNFAGNVNEGGIDAAAFAEGARYQIDYVRVYECSVNPLDGKGCETVRAGYKDEATDEKPTGALVLGVAPTPSAPAPEVATPITIFADAVNPSWPLWDCCAGSTPTVENDDAQHGAVAEFSVLGVPETVQGFFSRDVGTAYNASAMLTTGFFSFEMKMVTAPSDAGSVWLMKMEADGNTSDSGEIPLNASIEGVDPVVGEWQTYTFSVQSLADGGLDISAIDVIMMFPTWGTGSGAVYRIDNVKFEVPGITYPELVLFEDTANTAWPLWDCCAGSMPTEEIDDAAHGTVAEFSVLGVPETVQGFFGRDNGSFDASDLLTDGVFEFEMKVVTAPSDASSVWFMKMEADGNTSATPDTPLNTSEEGLDPVVGEWQTYTFKISDLADAGLDISAIDVVMVYPGWGTGSGAVYRIDNARIYNPNAASAGPTGPSLIAFSDAINPAWPLWDCCAGSTPSVEIDDAEHGAVAEFDVLDSAETVQGFYSRDAGTPFDASALLTTGTISFEMKVVTAPAAGTPWIFKVEAGGATSDTGDIALNTSQEGLDPVTGEWQTYTFDLLTLSDAGLDISAIDVIMIFPAWGQGAGAVYRVDNVIISNPNDTGGNGGSSAAALTLYADAMNAEWPLWDCCAGSTPSEEIDDAEHGSVAEFDVLASAETVQGFYSRDVGMPFDAESILSGTFSFEMKIVTAPADGTPWFLKMEADGNTSNTGDIPLNTSNEGQDPVAGVWQTYTFDVLALLDAGLDITAIDVVMVYPAWGQGAGAVYRIDNAVFKP
ncbi:MAG: beta-glucanase (GH16 family) [Paraglaciecola sp.]|jgi:beta-glucanase (GH16 family)